MAGFDLSNDNIKRPYGYDKFGFMVADVSDRREYEDRRKARPPGPQKSRSPFNERDVRLSPKRKEMIRERQDRQEDRADRRDDRFSPFRENFFRDELERRRRRSSEREYADRPDSWESQFNQPSINNYPPHTNLSTFSGDQMNLFPHGYEQQSSHYSGSSGMYGGYSQSLAPPPPSLPSLLNDLPQAPQPPDVQWHQPLPNAGSGIRPEDDHVKKEAIASEVRQQKATLVRQREEYLRKVDGLKKELDTLREQRAELRGNSRRSPSPDSRRFLKENAKLQLEIQNKLKTMNNVIDMLSGIIGEAPRSISPEKRKSAERKDYKRKSRSPGNSGQSSPALSLDRERERDKRSKKKSRSRSRSVTIEKKFNYVYYDPEMHWCRICNEFPPTAKDYLNHLHSVHHQKNAAPHMEAPWHNTPNLNEGLPNFPSASNKRTPIRGLQFFIPSTAWFCKLCDQWIGDLHCASAHLKSLIHSKNYTSFVEQNPHWEIDWMSDRQKAFQKARNEAIIEKSEVSSQPYTAHTITFDKDGFRTKRKLSPAEESDVSKTKKDKKKKKEKEKKIKKQKKHSSSSSSQSSDNSPPETSSVKVKQFKSSGKGNNIGARGESDDRQQEGWRRVSSPPPTGEDRMLSQWMSLQDDRLSEHDKRVLQNLKNRVKNRIAEEATSANMKKEAPNSGDKKNQDFSSRSGNPRNVHGPQEPQRGMQKESSNNADRKNQGPSGRSGHPRNVQGTQQGPQLGPRPQKERDMKDVIRDHLRGRDQDRSRDIRESRIREERLARDEKHRAAHQMMKEQEKEKKLQFQEQKKMPFIGKMPVFKTLVKPGAKPDEGKKNEPDPSIDEDTELAKKRRDEINAQIQKTVLEFKDKIKQQQDVLTARAVLSAPGLALPTALGGIVTGPNLQTLPPSIVASLPQTIHRIQKPPSVTTSAPTTVTASNKAKISNKDDPLHKDFQEALDIIFPSEEKKVAEIIADNEAMHMSMDPNLMMDGNMAGYGVMQGQMMSGGYMPQPGMPMMGPMPGQFQYDFNSLYHHQGMYDMQMPMGPQLPPHMNNNENGDDMLPPPEEMMPLPPPPPTISREEAMKAAKMQELDDLAMLGIDAEDVGAKGF